MEEDQRSKSAAAGNNNGRVGRDGRDDAECNCPIKCHFDPPPVAQLRQLSSLAAAAGRGAVALTRCAWRGGYCDERNFFARPRRPCSYNSMHVLRTGLLFIYFRHTS